MVADSPLNPVASEIQRRGYRAEKRFISVPTPWEVSQFRMRSRNVVSFKAEQAMPNQREKYYCRFSLSEETYDSNDDARQRLANLHREFQNGPIEDEYIRVLRDGFRVGTKTYILQTDGAIFLNEIRNLTKVLAGSIAGAERARALVAPPSNKSLDASGTIGLVVDNLSVA